MDFFSNEIFSLLYIYRAVWLEQENVKLRLENAHLKQENIQLRCKIYNSIES